MRLFGGWRIHPLGGVKVKPATVVADTPLGSDGVGVTGLGADPGKTHKNRHFTCSTRHHNRSLAFQELDLNLLSGHRQRHVSHLLAYLSPDIPYHFKCLR